MSQPQLKDELLPRDVALMALEDGRNLKEAVGWLVEWMMSHREWVGEREDAIWRTWAIQTVNTVMHDRRRTLIGETTKGGQIALGGSVVPFQSALADAVNANFSRMMQSPIWGGKRIGDATPAEIRESAEKFALNAKTLGRQSRWQEAVAAKAEANGCGVNEPVSTALKPSTFDELWEEINV